MERHDMMINETTFHSFLSRLDSLKECQLPTSSKSITELLKYLQSNEAVSRMSLQLLIPTLLLFVGQHTPE